MATFVLVPGAWLGAWCWRDVATILRQHGHDVVEVTLPGLADRAHLLTKEVGLNEHASDLSNRLRHDDLREAILVGHSYGGSVITAVAELVPERMRCLVFLDASTPCDGESTLDTLPASTSEEIRGMAAERGGGWLLPPPDGDEFSVAANTRRWIEQRLTAHPLKSLEQPVCRRSSLAAMLPRAFLRTSGPTSHYQSTLERARAKGWHCRELDGGHYPMFTRPHIVAEALIEAGHKCEDSDSNRHRGPDDVS